MNQAIVSSSRVRLARNIIGLPFPSKMDGEQMSQLVERIDKRINKNNDFTRYDMDLMKDLDRRVLVDRHLCSKELAQKKGGALFISKDESVSVLVGEEDHIRIQCILHGFSVEKCDTLASAIDALISAEGFAFDSALGYLTSCPTNVGTGMRASIMLHLPALTISGTIQNLAETISKFGFTIRGFYGESSEAQGDMYQLSNQVTLGVSEEEIIQNLNQLVRSIVDREEQVRALILKNDASNALKDRLNRSLGIAKFSRMMSTHEMMQKLSDIKLGVCLGLFEGITADEIDKLIIRGQSASIEAGLGKDTTENIRDEKRANMVRLGLKNCNVY